jgi:hypothetical protein
MNVPIRVNGADNVGRIHYITQSEFGFLDQWRKSLGTDKNPIRTDAVDFANLACKRLTAHSPLEIYARHADDISDHIQNNPLCEIANLVAMKCDSFPESEVIGLAHFRRSWSNNLILDYMAVHLWIGKPPEGYPTIIRGVGTALLFFICSIARRNQCGCVWGEATQNSCAFYQKVFDLDSVRDLLYIPHEKIVRFADNLEQKWKQNKH